MTKPELKEARQLVQWAVNCVEVFYEWMPPEILPQWHNELRKLKRVLRKKGLYR